ncbi:unnamed protein product [Caenorhabditis auriculariae]|uniref:Uncharacterized protein n=1 Tax=Caenorhabditis auriculariae TaxID=2777116 RepID=A0A8S1HXW2_9PELO|nr:unnamed protein product [Caenorhabditis auriculariae]
MVLRSFVSYSQTYNLILKLQPGDRALADYYYLISSRRLVGLIAALAWEYSDARQPRTSCAPYCSNMVKQFIRWYYQRAHIISQLSRRDLLDNDCGPKPAPTTNSSIIP